MVSIEDVLEVQNEQTKEVTHFAVGDVAVFTVADHTVEGGTAKVTGAIDAIHRVDHYVVVDSSTQFHSETRKLDVSKIIGIEKYVAPVTAPVETVPVTPAVVAPVVATPVTETATVVAEEPKTQTASVEEAKEAVCAPVSVEQPAAVSVAPTPMA